MAIYPFVRASILAMALLPGLFAGSPIVGQKLSEVEIADKGLMLPKTKVMGDRMVLEGKEIGYRTWRLAEGGGRVRTIYHLAARMGVDDINKPFIDALIAAKLPEFLPDSPYKTLTILNVGDSLWGTAGMGRSRLQDSQRNVPYALYVLDEKGLARAAWGLKEKESAVIVLDKDDTVLFFKEGKLSPADISHAVGLIKDKLGMK